MIKENNTSQNTGAETFANSGGESMSGKTLAKSIPGIPKMYEDPAPYREAGFSNYIMLASLAFVIQFVVTLICIFFYK